MAVSLGRTLVTAYDVGQFAQEYSLTRKGFKKDPDILSDFYDDLTDNINDLEKRANDFYKIIGVNGIKEFRETLSALDSSGFRQFTTRAINEATRTNKKFKKTTDRDIFNAIADIFSHSEGIGHTVWSTLIRNNGMAERLANFLAEGIGESYKVEHNKADISPKGKAEIKLRVDDILKTKSFSGLPKNKRQDYRKYVTMFLERYNSDNDLQSLNDTWVGKINTQELLSIAQQSEFEQNSILNFYPYYNLTPSEIELATNLNKPIGAGVWFAFKQRLKRLAIEGLPTIPKYWSEKAESVLDQLGPSAFITNNLNGVKGVLGEVQAGFLMAMFKNTDIYMTGNLHSEGNVKSGIDLVVNGTGIQVKNYQGYGGKEFLEGLHLARTLTFRELSDRVSDAVPMNEVGQYLTIVNYNKPVKKKDDLWHEGATDAYKGLYSSLASKTGAADRMLDIILASNLGAFFKIQDKLIDSPKYKDLLHNVFYIFGGSEIIPTSRILMAIRDKLVKLEKELEDNEKTSSGNFNSSTIVGSIPTWNRNDKPVNINNILNKIKVHMDFNIYIGDLNLENLNF